MTEHSPHGPLVIDTRRLIRRAGSMMEDTLEAASPSRIGTDVVAIADGEPLHIDYRLESVMEGVLVSGSVESRATGVCVRCLDDIELDVDVQFQELFAYTDRAAHHEEVAEEDDDQRTLEGDQIDLEPVIVDAVVLSLPFQPVCDPDCPGLCSECGIHLADEPGHHHEQLDPRWAALGSLVSETDATGADSEDQPVSHTGSTDHLINPEKRN